MSTSIIKSVFWLTVSEIIFNISGYVIHSAVGRILGPEDYGRYGLVITLTTIVIILIGKGVPTAMSKYISEIYTSHPQLVHSIKKQAITLQLLIMGIITLLFFLCAPLIAQALGDPTLTPLFQLSSLIIPTFAAASFYFSFFTGLHKFNVQAILKTIRGIARLILIIALAYFFSIEGTIIGYILAPLVVFLTAIGIDMLYYRHAPWKQTIPTETFAWKKLASFAGPIIFFMLFYELFISIDLFLVKRLLQNDFLTGIYNGAITIGRIPYFLFYALTIVMFPTISHSTANNNDTRTKAVIYQTLRWQLILLIPTAALMIVFAPSLVSLFYGESYMQATGPLTLLTIGAIFLTVFYVFSFALNGAGKIKTMMSLGALGLLLNTTLNIFFIPQFGIMGAAFSSLIATLFITLIILYFVQKNFSVPFPFFTLLKTLVASSILLYAGTLFPQHMILFMIWGALLFGFYFFLLYLMKELRKEDLSLLKDLRKK